MLVTHDSRNFTFLVLDDLARRSLLSLALSSCLILAHMNVATMLRSPLRAIGLIIVTVVLIKPISLENRRQDLPFDSDLLAGHYFRRGH